jgi:hypothetical protein
LIFEVSAEFPFCGSFCHFAGQTYAQQKRSVGFGEIFCVAGRADFCRRADFWRAAALAEEFFGDDVRAAAAAISDRVNNK